VRKTLVAAAIAAAACQGPVEEGATRAGPVFTALSTSAVVVNECMSGSGGWIELLNSSSVPVDLARDPASCWYADDSEGGGSPKAITDATVNHPAGSTTCAAAGRSATCGIVAPGEHVWVGYPYLNPVTPDACRLLATTRTSGVCGTDFADLGAGGPTASTAAGQCFGRKPDGTVWSATSLTCTRGDVNPSPPPPPPPPPPTGPVLVRLGRPDRILLSGTLVTPDTAFDGEILVEGDTITCLAASCSADPGAADASVVQTNGIVFPGLIDTHNHILFDVFDETDWAPSKLYTNHNQWPNEARYGAMVDAKQYLNGESGSPVSIGCEMEKYGEVKALIAGTTSVVGAANPANRECYGSLARTIDQTANDLGSDRVQVATLFPSPSAADAVCRNLQVGTTDAYLIHIAEGVDASALREFAKLGTVTTVDGCLYSPKTTVVHGTALGEAELSAMAANHMSLVWSPRSNVFLYGGGADLTRTANVPLALSKGINVALAPDWSIGGSQDLLDELRFADQVDNAVWGDVLTPQALARMVTVNAAHALGLDATLGSLAVGKKADLTVIAGDRARPFDALLSATPSKVQLVLVGGVALYGDLNLEPLGPALPGCEDLAICGESKFLCAAESAGSATNKLGQTFSEIVATLKTELQKYDDLALTPWKFSPLAPLVSCGP
jgi:cytosine/adenosine deaminase-related metal-dependent hydrolase